MKTGFACPACLVPLVLKCVSTQLEELMLDVAPSVCPNPFCRMELPSRRGDVSLTYALVGTVLAEAEDERL